jgi:hypothetical protein
VINFYAAKYQGMIKHGLRSGRVVGLPGPRRPVNLNRPLYGPALGLLLYAKAQFAVIELALQTRLPDRLHPVSRMLLEQWISGALSTPEFLRGTSAATPPKKFAGLSTVCYNPAARPLGRAAAHPGRSPGALDPR